MLDRVEQLRTRLVTGREFADILAWFDDHVAAHPDLFAYSRSRDQPLLLAVIQRCAEQVRPTFELQRHQMFALRGTGFWHGIANGQRDYVYFFYYESLGLGLAAMCNLFDPRGTAHFLRFSLVTPGEGATPGRTTRGST